MASPFGIRIGELFSGGVRGYRANLGPLTAAAVVTMACFAVFRYPAQMALNDGRLATSAGLDLIGLFVGGTVAYPWFSYALDAASGVEIRVLEPFRHGRRFRAQAVGSLWFWAGVLLGFRYLYGLPSIIVIVFYVLYGYVIADGDDRGGLRALGTSVRLGHGRRIGLFSLIALFGLFNMCGALPVGFAVNPFTVALTILGLIITTNVTMVAGAHMFYALGEQVEKNS